MDILGGAVAQFIDKIGVRRDSRWLCLVELRRPCFVVETFVRMESWMASIREQQQARQGKI